VNEEIGAQPEPLDGEGEVLPVLADVRVIEPQRATAKPAVQAAAVAGASFVAGAATIAVIRRHRSRPPSSRKRRRAAKRGTSQVFGEVVSSRSFLVDVHLLSRD
jgi:hypothetical protein